MLKDYENLDFDAIKEDWNEYEIEDGDRLRIKFVLVKIIRKKVADGYDFRFNSTNVVGIFSKKSREPGQKMYTPDEIFSSVIKKNMEYKTIKEVWNKYLIKKDKSIIEVKIVITEIQKTNKVDDFGDLHYLVKVQPVFRGGEPPKK